MKMLIPYILVIVLTMLFPLSTVDAQTLSFSLNPPLHFIAIEPGQQISRSITIRNNSDQSLTLDLEPIAVSSSNDKRGSLKPVSADKDHAEFIRQLDIMDKEIKIERFVLEPRQEKTIQVNFTVPTGQRYHDYYFALTFTSSSKDTATESSLSRINNSIGSTFILYREDAQTNNQLSFALEAPQFISSGPLNITAAAQNQAESATNVDTKVVISDMFGRTIEEYDLQPALLLTNETRILRAQAGNLSSTTATIRLDSTLLLGRYTISLLNEKQGNRPVQNSTVYAFPINSLVYVSIAIIFILGISLRVLKKINI